MQPFHIAATGHGVNYLPQAVAAREGFFAAEGLHVTTTVARPWPDALAALDAGRADAVLGGLWVPAMFHGRGREYAAFAQLSARASMAVLGRSPAPFRWPDLADRVVAIPGDGGASYALFIRMLLREHGVDPADVRLVQDLDAALLGRLFEGGLADYLVLDAAAALRLAATPGLHRVSLLADSGGPVPWSVYYASGPGTAERLDTHTRFCRALARGMAWLRQHPAAACRSLLAAEFPAADPAALLGLVEAYRCCGMWDTPRIDPAAHDRWQRGIAAGHLVDLPLPYAAIIDARPTAGLGPILA